MFVGAGGVRDALENQVASRQKLHELFAESLIWLEVADPPRLWRTYMEMMQAQRDERDDEKYSGMSNADLACEAYASVDEVLGGYGMDMSKFGIDAPSPDAVDPRRAYREYAEELREPLSQEKELHENGAK